MYFYLDESGDFRVPTDGRQHAVGIVLGVVIPDETQPDVFRRFSRFTRSLPAGAFSGGEPKGRLLDAASRRDFAELIAVDKSILVCPIMLDLTLLGRRSEVDVRSSVVCRLNEWASVCKHQSMREELELLARQFRNLSTEQALRLATWARCILRCIQHSVISHCGEEYHASWSRPHFEIDLVQIRKGSREERVFETMLLAWLAGWSVNTPLITLEEIHTSEHPFIQLYGLHEGIDVAKLVRGNVRFVSSRDSLGVQIADMGATIVSEAVRGLTIAEDLENYGRMMSQSIGRPLEATGLFSLVEPSWEDIEDWSRRYYGIAEVIDTIRQRR